MRTFTNISHWSGGYPHHIKINIFIILNRFIENIIQAIIEDVVLDLHVVASEIHFLQQSAFNLFLQSLQRMCFGILVFVLGGLLGQGLSVPVGVCKTVPRFMSCSAATKASFFFCLFFRSAIDPFGFTLTPALALGSGSKRALLRRVLPGLGLGYWARLPLSPTVRC